MSALMGEKNDGPVLLVGNPNAGKTTLFNALTGLNARVANFPGVTVEAKLGTLQRFKNQPTTIVDLPGTYSLIPNSEDEELTIKAILGEVKQLPPHQLIVVVVDACECRRGLYLFSQIIELGFRAIIALTMVDQRPELKQKKYIDALQNTLGTYVVPVSANDPQSIKKLNSTIDALLSGSLKPQLKDLPRLYKNISSELQKKLALGPSLCTPLSQSVANSAVLTKNYNLYLFGLARRGRLKKSMAQLAHLDLLPQEISELDAVICRLPEERFARVDTWVETLAGAKNSNRDWSDRIDRFMLHPILGSVFIVFLFAAMLQGLFLLAEPIADFLGDNFASFGEQVASFLPEGSMIHSLFLNGVVEGMGSILSFVPLIALLFLFLAILEDSGYLARATFLLDNLLTKLGLCGRSLAPMLSGFACAVPAIMATRTIGCRKERLITILVTPFLTCSARLPVFGLIVSALFSTAPPLFGVINVGALLFLAMYVLGLLAAVFAAFILSKVLKGQDSQNLTIELPPYRWPRPKPIFKRVLDRIVVFMKDVGSVILAATVIIWALFYFQPPGQSVPTAGDQIEIQNTLVAGKNIEQSYAGLIGKAIEPMVSPFGLDWQVGVGIFASFLAREVFVSTLAVTYGVSDDLKDQSLKEAFKEKVSPLAGLCLLIFFTLSMQCVSTLAATKRETRSFFWPTLQFFMMSISAYLIALITFFTGSFLGFV